MTSSSATTKPGSANSRNAARQFQCAAMIPASTAPVSAPAGLPSWTSAMVDARRLRGTTSATSEAAGGVNPASPSPTTSRASASCAKPPACPVTNVAADQTMVASAMIRVRERRSATRPIGMPAAA